MGLMLSHARALDHQTNSYPVDIRRCSHVWWGKSLKDVSDKIDEVM